MLQRKQREIVSSSIKNIMKTPLCIHGIKQPQLCCIYRLKPQSAALHLAITPGKKKHHILLCNNQILTKPSMAQKKHSFRFRIPWFSVAPESFSRRSKDTSKTPTHSDTNVPIQRPSRPSSVITPLGSPPSASKTEGGTPATTEPQKQSPPHPSPPTPPSSSVIVETTTQSKPPSPPPPSLQPSSHVHVVVSTQPQSPSQSHNLASDDTMNVPNTHPASSSSSSSDSEQEKDKTMVNRSEPVPQEAKPEAEAELKVNSPLRAMTKSPPETQPAASEQQQQQEASSIPSSKTEPASQPHHHPPSPSNEVLKANLEETALRAPSTSREEKEKMAVAVAVSEELVPQESEEPKMNSPLKIIPRSPENLSAKPTATLDEERSISTTPKAPLGTQSKFLQHEEKEKVENETKKVGKSKDTKSTTSQPTQHAKASTSGTKAKDRFDKKQHGVRETLERKIMFATSNSSGKDIGVVSSTTDPGTRNVLSSTSISPQRTVSSTEENEKEKAPLQKGIKDDISKFVHKLAASVNPTQAMEEDKQFSVITLSGDNRGATMHVGGSESDKKEGSIHIHRAYKNEPEESTEVTTDGEGNSTNSNTEEEDSMEEHGEVGEAYVNSNIQSINNSLMFHGSVTERDPGVQVTLPQKHLDSIKPDDKDTQRHMTEFNISRSQKPTYQPTVQRRRLTVPFPEPSESDPDNPDKPRRHGCKFSCGKNIEDIEIL